MPFFVRICRVSWRPLPACSCRAPLRKSAWSIAPDVRSTGLHSEIVLCKCDLRLAGIAVLRNQVAGIAGQHIIINLALRTFGKFDHFPDAGKMILDMLSCVYTRIPRLFDYIVEFFPLRIAEKPAKFSRTPTFVPSYSLAIDSNCSNNSFISSVFIYPTSIYYSFL